MVLALCTYTSLVQGILYLCFGAFPLVFGNNHGFTLWQIGLAFIGLLVGNVVACFCNPFWHKNWMGLIRKMKERHGPDYKPEPELRLPPAMVGSVMITGPLFWFAWTTYSSVHWIVPIIATVFFSVGYDISFFPDKRCYILILMVVRSFFVFQGVWTFMMAAYPKYAASAMAVNTTTRCILSAAFPLFTNQSKAPTNDKDGCGANCISVYNKLGYQWASSLVAFLTLAMLPLP